MAPDTRKSWEGDVKPFFSHIEEQHGFPGEKQHLTAFQFGTETFVGRGRFGVWYWMGELRDMD